MINAEIVEPNVKIPLIVDLDGTLLRSDMLLETGLAFLHEQPLQCFRLFGWLAQGKTVLKERLARATDIDVQVLPYDQQVLELIESARAEGREVVLATATHERLAERIAAHLQVFDRVLATSGECNLSAANKKDLLVRHFGCRGFDYMGNSRDDLLVWGAARRALVVNPEQGVEKRARALSNVDQVIVSNRPGITDWLEALRLHQWTKNLLIFVPLLAAHELLNPLLLGQGLLAFILFGLCASSVYVLNDLVDLTDDRHHATKRFRPFASGRLPIRFGLLIFPLLLAIAFAGALAFLPLRFTLVLAAYYGFTLLYSLWLKQQVAVDVIALAMLYTVRVIAGAAAFGLELTFWILAFSMFIFLSLALVKRYTELREARQKGSVMKARGRGYYPEDLEIISSLGASSGYLAVLVLALYINDQSALELYSQPKVIWLACPLLLFWVTRVWMLTHRGQIHDDPVVFAIQDRVSLFVGALFCLVFWVAT